MKIELNKVTWCSKLLTVIFLVVVLPALAFYIGAQCQKTFIEYSTLTATASLRNLASVDQGADCFLMPYTGKLPLNLSDYYYLDNNDVRGGMVCKFLINPALPVFTFHFVGQMDNTLGNIEITEDGDSSTLETISNTTDYEIALAQTENLLTTVDANFDGYKDLLVLNGCGTGGSCLYDLYIYDPATNHFVRNNSLRNLANPSFDYEKEQVATNLKAGVFDFRSDTYQYIDGEYVLVKKEVSVSDVSNNTVTKKTYEIKNGNMELVRSTTIPVNLGI